MEQEPIELKLAFQQMAVKDASLVFFGLIFVWAVKQGWLTREQIVEVVRNARDRPAPFPLSLMPEVPEDLAIEIEKKDDPHDHWRVIPGGKTVKL
jgi:hypothetical protein